MAAILKAEELDEQTLKLLGIKTPETKRRIPVADIRGAAMKLLAGLTKFTSRERTEILRHAFAVNRAESEIITKGNQP